MTSMRGVFLDVRPGAEHIGKRIAATLVELGVAIAVDAENAAFHITCVWRATSASAEPPRTNARSVLVSICTVGERSHLLGAGFDDVLTAAPGHLEAGLRALLCPGVAKAKARDRGFFSRYEGRFFDFVCAANGAEVTHADFHAHIGEREPLRTRRLTMLKKRVKDKLPPEDAERLEASTKTFRFRRR